MWKASDGARTERQSIYLEIWRRLRDRSAADCDATLENLRRVLGRPPLDVRDLPMTRAELADMLAGGLIELGAHTISHRPLTALDPAQCRQELRGCRLECEQLAGAAIAGFAYPHGEVNAAACAVVEECGFEWACSLRRRAVRTGDDRYALPRLHVPDCSGAELAQALTRAAA
jgi:peptidoglycan/xylan/chitin deacetylase (PgdA/CDA1 family)